jgi:hypothetical protein
MPDALAAERDLDFVNDDLIFHRIARCRCAR